MTNQSGISDACVFVSIALFIVYMKRQKVTNVSGSPSRWGAFFGSLSGKYTIASNSSSSGSGSSGSSNTSSATPGSSVNKATESPGPIVAN